ASISSAPTRKPVWSRSTWSSFRLSSIKARSPRAATSAMIPRTTASTSADASRLAARKARKRSVKSGARRSRRIGMALSYRPGRISGQWRGWEEPSTPGVGRVVGMDRTHGRRPGRPQIGKLGFQAFDLEPQRPPARENEIHDPGGRIGLGKFDREEVEHRVLAGGVGGLALSAFDAPQAQRRAATAEFGVLSPGGEPVEAA